MAFLSQANEPSGTLVNGNITQVPMCMFHIFSFISSFYSFASIFLIFFMHPLVHLLFFSFSLSLSKYFGELLSTGKCSIFCINPSLLLSVSLSQQEKRGTLLNQAPELTQRSTKAHHHHHQHPWEPVNNSACRPMRHHAQT